MCTIVTESVVAVVAMVYRIVFESSCTIVAVPAAVVVTAGTSFAPINVAMYLVFARARAE